MADCELKEFQMITLVEIPLFQKRVDDVMNEEELREFKDFLARHPQKGDVIRGTGGLRKVRWGIQGSGKSGGARVIYYYHHEDMPLFLITAYRKADKKALTDDERKQLKGLGKRLVEAYEA